VEKILSWQANSRSASQKKNPFLCNSRSTRKFTWRDSCSQPSAKWMQSAISWPTLKNILSWPCQKELVSMNVLPTLYSTPDLDLSW